MGLTRLITHMPKPSSQFVTAFLFLLICLSTNAQDQENQHGALFRIEQNGKWGYIDRLGNIAIEPRFEAVGEFSERLAAVEVGGKWGFIDRNGNVVIEPRFSGAYEFSEGLARIQVGGDKYGMYGKWGFIDRNGAIVIEPRYGELTGVAETSNGFHEGLAMIEVNFQKGFIDKVGSVIIAPKFQFGYHFTEGLACVSVGLDQKWGYIDKAGEWIIPPRFDQASLFSEGLAPVALNGVCGFTDRRGNLKLIPPFKRSADCAVVWGHFNGGLSRWKIGEKYGYIDKSGKAVIQPVFDLTDQFSEGMAYVETDGRYGFVDASGKMTVEPQFYHARSFQNGLARVNYARDSWGYIDKTGKIVWKIEAPAPPESEPISFIQTGHTRDLLFVGWSLDGNLLASYSAADGWIKIWNPQKGQLLWSVKATGLNRSHSLSSPDGLLRASGVRDEAYEISDAKTGAVIWKIPAHSTSGERVTNPDHSVVAERGLYGDASVRLYDAESNSLIRRLEGHPGIVFAVAFSPDGKIVATGSGDRTIRFWDSRTGSLLKTLLGHTRQVTSIAFSGDGLFLVSGSEDDTLRIWDVASGKTVRATAAFTHGVSGVHSVSYSPDGRTVVVASGTQVKLFETATSKLLRAFETHESHTSRGPQGIQRTICCGSEARSAVFSPNGELIVSGHEDGTVKLWNVKTGKLVRIIKSRSDVRSVAFSPDGKLIASGNRDDNGRIELWSARTGRLVRRFGEQSDYVESLAFSPDSTRLVSGHLLGVRLWNVGTGRLVREFNQGFSEDDHVAFSPDGERIVSGGENQNVLLWDTKSGRLIWSLMPIDTETKKQKEDKAKINAGFQVEHSRKTRLADLEVAAWKNKVFVTFEHFGEPIDQLEQRMVEDGEARKSIRKESLADATGAWLKLHNTSPLPISFHTDSAYLPRPNCGVVLSNGSRVGLCDGAEVSIQYEIKEASGKPVSYGIDVSGLSVLAPGTSVLFSVPLVHLKNSRVIIIRYSYVKENDKHQLEEYGSPHRVVARHAALRVK